MKIILHNITNITTNQDKLKVIGTFYSQDRYYTLLNNSIDKNLQRKSKILAFVVAYLFQSSNYKHMSSISNDKTKGMWLADILCWLSIIGFLACFFAGIATPLIKAFPAGKFDFDAFQNAFRGSGVALLSLALFFLIISIAYLYVIFKIKKINQKLLLKDYVLKKLDFILKFKSFLKVSNIIVEAEKTEEYLILAKTEVLTDADRWLFLQITNLAFMLFPDFNLILQFDNIEQEYFNSLQQIIHHDFHNINILLVDQDNQ